MRLRSLESYWLIKNGLINSYPSLQNQQLSTEIVVIGGGITGALISYSLIKNNHKVILIDKGDIGQGCTAATTAMLQYEIDVPLIELEKLKGKEDAELCYTEGIKAIEDLQKIIVKEKIECGFKTKGSFYAAHNISSAKKLKKEYEARKEAGIQVEWINKTNAKSKFGIESFGGIFSKTAASLDAYSLAHSLIELGVKKGLQVYDQTEISTIDYKKRKPIIHLKDNATIKCDKIIYCNGYEAINETDKNIADIYTTYACVSEQMKRIPLLFKNNLLWNTQDPYFYARATEDNRILIGGEDTKADKNLSQISKERKSKKLIKTLYKMFPQVEFTEDFSWSGKFGTTKDGLPYIDQHPKHNNAFCVLGFGGNGITFSIQAMQMVEDWLNEKPNKLQQLYTFKR